MFLAVLLVSLVGSRDVKVMKEIKLTRGEFCRQMVREYVFGRYSEITKIIGSLVELYKDNHGADIMSFANWVLEDLAKECQERVTEKELQAVNTVKTKRSYREYYSLVSHVKFIDIITPIFHCFN